MVKPVNSETSVGWKNQREAATETEFLRWFYVNSNTQERQRLEEEFVNETGKSLPSSYR